MTALLSNVLEQCIPEQDNGALIQCVIGQAQGSTTMTAMLYNVLVQINHERVADVIKMYIILDLRDRFRSGKHEMLILVP